MVLEPYTVREARIHVRHIRDLLKSVDPADAYNGVDCNSLSFLNTVTVGDILGQLNTLSHQWVINCSSCWLSIYFFASFIDKKRSKPDSVDCTPPDFIMPSSKERPLLPLHPGLKDLKVCFQFCLLVWPWQNLCGNIILFFFFFCYSVTWFCVFLQGPQCLKVLTYTGWNPPPGNRRMHGKKHVSLIPKLTL